MWQYGLKQCTQEPTKTADGQLTQEREKGERRGEEGRGEENKPPPEDPVRRLFKKSWKIFCNYG